MASQSVFRIVAGANSYDWGKIGKNSKAGQYARADPEFKLQEEKPYSELWMGTHPTLPSKLQSGEKLYDHLQAHPELLGIKCASNTAAISLSYDNHKPEMAIAITPFSGFCNFRPLSEISTFLSAVPEFASLIPEKAASALSSSPSDPKSTLRDVFGALMSAPSDQVQSALDQLVKRYESGGATSAESQVADLAQTLAKQYPGDVGVFCVFLLNVVKLNEGEAMFLQADEPHAYISGADIIECMATSDNVVRAGLTPKLRDVPTLVSMLTYNSGPADAQRMEPKPFKGESSDSDSFTTLYDPPIPEFSVLLTDIPAGKKASHRALEGPSIFIVTSGSGNVSGQEIKSEGEVWFAGAGQSLEFTAGDQGLVLYRAFVRGLIDTS
ncbi:Phosphomannose isomerase type I [Rhizoctonia solani]|uniref:Mannose-6-phosphate isomerase n=1 Tax=Rhizoctonia solani TaxID=456999 RepID=A0A8H7IMR0_9AGAM|nr:Phosphomannose isomerase type I [Rhizoctonia solani]